MNRFIVKKFVVLAALLAVLSLSATTTEAAVILRLIDSVAGTITITDNGAGPPPDSNPAVNAVTFVGALGVWNINVSTGLGTALGPGGSLDLNSVNNSTGAGTLQIELTETGIIPPGAGTFGVRSLFGGTLTGAAGSTVLAQAWGNNTNTAFGTQQLAGTIGPFGLGAFSGSANGAITVGPGAYSLTQRITITATGAVQYSGDFNTQVPEPTIMGLFGLGLLGVAARRRRKAA